MVRRIVVPLALLALLAAAFAVPATAGSRKPQHKTVRVIDFAFTPKQATVTPGSRITWKWSAQNATAHDVKLVSAPRGVKKFTSPVYTAGTSFSRVLTKAGTYRFVCTFHPNMRETIVVAR